MSNFHAVMSCRPGCGACCIVPSIASPLPGMPAGKPAGVVCAHLDEAGRCRLFGRPERPAVCRRFTPDPAWCGANRDEAMALLWAWERDTAPSP